ncbi:MAG: transposase, partial [Gemmatimonadota bacterium]
MASITKKMVHGHPYYYARECKRVGGKPKIVWQKYLGRIEDIAAAVDEQKKGKKGYPVPQPEDESLVTEFGAAAALHDLSCRLGLVEIIDHHVPKRGSGPSVGTYLGAAVLNRCLAPRSKARLGDWFEATV